jgi:hypothetical protein
MNCQCGEITGEHCEREADSTVRYVPAYLKGTLKALHGNRRGLELAIEVNEECAKDLLWFVKEDDL